MSLPSRSDTEYFQHGKEASSGSLHNHNRVGTPSRNTQPAEEYYDDDDELFDELYSHERLPTEPQRLDLELPEANLDLTMTFNSILEAAKPSGEQEMDRVQKRASNVMKLTEQNEKLKEELRAMTERLEAAERKQKDLESRRSAEGAR
ncbi:hypothetical protein GSI_13782 [Ganoderma sinense ZZ0214-1]|uniref:Uncharacterized protein n=1 Tax=Ganoderma sinense ZZ0214-1 TaxID=1077348 RepID=A0A2G8RRB4_9APHY|nr:hypothetical protein GSI_13782 [Ganoderma sinense ZZ0214-1]